MTKSRLKSGLIIGAFTLLLMAQTNTFFTSWRLQVAKAKNVVLLPAPDGLVAQGGSGQVSLRWKPVPEAAGYLVYRAESLEAPLQPLDHGGRDVLAIPSTSYADTTGLPDRTYWYAVAALRAADGAPGKISDKVQASSNIRPPAPIVMRVDASASAGKLEQVWHMVGSEHLSQLFDTSKSGGKVIGPDFEESLRLARTELGATLVRAHNILSDELGVYREVNGEPVYDFTKIDQIFDRVRALGLRPIVELSFMPEALATDPTATIFSYGGIVSPPKDWRRWAELNQKLARHLVERYGLEEVREWGFEVWNEPNLGGFWTGNPREQSYFRLYQEAARAIKSVDNKLKVGGPATAAAGWIESFLDYVLKNKLPLDFLSTHTYGNPPLNVGAALKSRKMKNVEVWWTEWGITPSHFNPINDLPFGAPFVLHGMAAVQGNAKYLAYWVISDHFEELGRPQALFHGGFGLLTVGNLRKPRYWALKLLEELGTERIKLEMGGDGAGSLVDAFATRKPDGSIYVLAWNGTLDQTKAGGWGLLDRRVILKLRGLGAQKYRASLARVDNYNSNALARYRALAEHWGTTSAWPTEDQWKILKQGDQLDERTLPAPSMEAGVLTVAFDLPMPGVARLKLIPETK